MTSHETWCKNHQWSCKVWKKKRFDWIEERDRLDICENVENEVEKASNVNVLKDNIDDWDALKDALDAKELKKNVIDNCTSLKRRKSHDVINVASIVDFDDVNDNLTCLLLFSFKRFLNVSTNFLKTIKNIKKDVKEVSNVDVCHVLKVNIDDWNVLRNALDALSELTNLRTCFKRTCSWSLLFELKSFSQCL